LGVKVRRIRQRVAPVRIAITTDSMKVPGVVTASNSLQG
jgi:hypothetical protein